MITPSQGRRLWAFILLMIIAFVGLAYRCVELQVLRHEELKPLAAKNTKRSFFREARRGDIQDVHGHLLATSRLVKTVCADPTLIYCPEVGDRVAEVAVQLAPWLQIPEADLKQRLTLRWFTNAQGQAVLDRYVVLKRRVPVERWEQVRQAMRALTFAVDEAALPKAQRRYFDRLRQMAIFVEDELIREYPNQRLAAHVIGFCGLSDQPPGAAGRAAGLEGKDGIELTMNQALNGIPGWLQTELDVRKREVAAFRQQDVAPRPGANVVLTIDVELQHILETALWEAMQKHTPISASGIMVRPQTGEILALATMPNYDPNNPGAFLPDCRRNRVITDIAEPGSTFKIVVATGAMNEGLVALSDRVDCEQGQFIYCGRILHDHARYGLLSVEEVIAKSSNIGAAKIGIRLGPQRLYQYMRHFGFGDRTGIPLLGEQRGIVHPLKEWNKLSISRIPMGHEVAVTPLQMVLAMGALANQGRLMYPLLIDRLEDEKGRLIVKYQPRIVRQVCSEHTATRLVTALKSAVSTNGTAIKASLDNYRVAGKTGTAQKATRNGYIPGKYFSSFIGFFPADRPEICIGIFLDEPRQGYYGGQTAAPFFKMMAERAASYLCIRPDYLAGATLAISPALAQRRTQ